MSEARAKKPYPLRIPENLMELAEAKSRTERMDKSTVLRQLLYAGAEGYAMELLGLGRISSGKAAELLNTSVHRVHELARERGLEIGADAEDHRRSRKAATEPLQ